jgi:UDP-N-acetylmuramoylalanine--D-glutamate ligase
MNWDLHDFNGKAVIFIGRGREGQSFETFIKANAAITSFLFIDQQDDPHYLESLEKLDFTKTIIVKTAGCPGRLVPAPYTTPTKVFFDCINQIGATVIGVTGTKGKTTTASLLGEMLKTTNQDIRVCGNIGLPMLDYLENASKNTIYVVELSSYQLAELEISPHIAIVTNLYNDHTDYHGSLEAYWEAKHNIMRYMSGHDTLIYNPDSQAVLDWLKVSPAQSIAIDPNEYVDMSKTQLLGSHNKSNALMALHAALLMGVDKATCQEVIDHFEPVKHRLQRVAVKKGVIFVDDAIGSNPEATIAGITTLIKEVGPVGCVMLGGQDRNYEYWPLMQLISRLAIPKLVLFPDTGAKLKALIPSTYKDKVELFETTDMQKAVEWAAANTPKKSICLLSTAAPSYSVWKDFEEKGDLFQEAVKTLPD